MAAVTITVQFKDGSTRENLSVECSSGNRGYTNRQGQVVFDNLTKGEEYRVSCKGVSETFTAGRTAKVVINVR